MTVPTHIESSQLLKATAGFLDYVRDDLEAIEEELDRQITSEVRKVHALSGYVLSAGGKRLRPAMVALSARAVQPLPDRHRLVVLGAAMELVHMATLLHDDVVDNTATRRGRATANAVFGNGVAVLTGDFLLARAMRMLAGDGDLELMRIISETTIEMSEGEIMEILATGDPRITAGHYFEILHKKTAVFVGGCCRGGAVVGGAGGEQAQALEQYGRHLGMAFQIADDLLDYTGDPQLTGKPVGSDLRDGRATLPFLIALTEARSTDRDLILAAFGNSALDADAIAQVVSVMQRYGVFDATRAAACSHVERAHDTLAVLLPSRSRECFESLTDYVIQRDR